uniref:tetratricopeptide repeat protein n=1 Tax=Saccharothrix mutabilis TaxID=33921 RepID=UPI0031D3584D
MSFRDVTNSVSNSWINGPSIQIGSADTVTLALDRPDHQVQWLRAAPRDGRVPVRQRSPSYLLDARREVVPFWPRTYVQDLLAEWCDDTESPVSVLLVHGAGGQGKTRLASALAGRCHALGWAVARAVSRPDFPGDVLPDGPENTGPADGESPVLVVVDYAERWSVDVLVHLIVTLSTGFPDRTVRVLLLARSTASWLPVADRVDRLAALAEPIELGDLASPDERADAFSAAAAAFGAVLDVPTTPEPPDLSAPAYGSALTLHMSALAAVCAQRDHDRQPELSDLSTYLLRHEGRFWPPGRRGKIADAVFAATLLGPVRHPEEAEALADRLGIARDVLLTHEELYPPDDDTALHPLRPDRLGEDFLAEHLRRHRRAEGLLRRVMAVAEPATLRRALTILAAAADRHPDMRNALWSTLTPETVAEAGEPLVRTVIAHAPSHIAQAVSDALPHRRVDLLQPAADLARRLVNEQPTGTSSLDRGWAKVVLGIRLTEAGRSHEGLPWAQRGCDEMAMSSPGDPEHLIQVAKALNILGIVESASGYDEEALRSAALATQFFRGLVDRFPEFKGDCADCLTTYANRLADAFRYAEAVAMAKEALTLRRELASHSHADHVKLADTLSALGLHLGRAQHTDEALACTEEALTLYRRFAEQDPDGFLAPLSRTSHNLSLHLAASGRHTEALDAAIEAVTNTRQLLNLNHIAHLPTLRTQLSLLGWRRADVGDLSGALADCTEAIRIARELKAIDERAFSSHLAQACMTLAYIQSQHPTHHSQALPEALAAVEEALTTYRQLATTHRMYTPFIPPLLELQATLEEAWKRQ